MPKNEILVHRDVQSKIPTHTLVVLYEDDGNGYDQVWDMIELEGDLRTENDDFFLNLKGDHLRQFITQAKVEIFNKAERDYKAAAARAK